MSLLEGRAFAELTPREAVEFLGVLAQLQVVRSAIACVPVLTTAAVLDVTGAARSWSSLMWAVTFAAVLIVPMYILVLAGVQLYLRRCATEVETLDQRHKLVLRVLRLGPLVGVLLAALVGWLFH
ncbi:MAG TPA: hypothetical protein VHO29_11770 [Marmoricola sp.]|nr:hypothetical protein [Marmoricola sp.]